MGSAELLQKEMEIYTEARERFDEAVESGDFEKTLARCGEMMCAADALLTAHRNLIVEENLKRLNKMKQQGSEPDAQARDQSNDQPADQ